MSDEPALDPELATALAAARGEATTSADETSQGKGSATSAAAPDSEGRSHGGGQGSNPPAPADAPDLDWAPKRLRHRIESEKWTPEEVNEAKSGFMAHGEFTRRNQNLIEREKILRSESRDTQDDAILGWKLRNVPALNKVVMEWMAAHPDGKGESDKAEEDVPDIFNMAPDEARAALKEWQARIVRQAQEGAVGAIEGKYVKPRQAEYDFAKALEDEFIVKRGVAKDEVIEAGRKAIKHAISLGVAYTPENAIVLTEPFLGSVNKTTPPPLTQNGNRGAPAAEPVVRRVATPAVGSGAIAPAAPLAHQREGRFPTTNEEFVQQLRRDLSDEYGVEVSSLQDVLP